MGRPLLALSHMTLPVAASRQERTPAMPYVQTFPSATAGELRGPPWLPHMPMAAPRTASAMYLSSHQGPRDIPYAHGDLPLLPQFPGPRGRFGEGAHCGVPVGPAPLRPV